MRYSIIVFSIIFYNICEINIAHTQRVDDVRFDTKYHAPFYFNRDAVWKTNMPKVQTDTTGCPCDSDWSPIHQLSFNNSSYLRLAAQGENIIHCTWSETDFSPVGRKIMYARSLDGGITYDSSRNILMDSMLYRSGVDGENLVTNEKYVYLFFEGGGRKESPFYSPIWMMRSADSGAHWENPRPILYGTDSTDYLHQAAISGDTIALLYSSKKLRDNLTILYSTNAGENWKPTKAKLPKGSEYRIGITPGYFHLVYVKYGKKKFVGGELVYRHSEKVGRKKIFFRCRIVIHRSVQVLQHRAMARYMSCG